MAIIIEHPGLESITACFGASCRSLASGHFAVYCAGARALQMYLLSSSQILAYAENCLLSLAFAMQQARMQRQAEEGYYPAWTEYTLYYLFAYHSGLNDLYHTPGDQ